VPAQLFQPFLPPPSLPDVLSAGVGSPAHLVPVYNDPAVVGFVLGLPVLKKIQARVIDMP
jgi:hypothetical protein